MESLPNREFKKPSELFTRLSNFLVCGVHELPDVIDIDNFDDVMEMVRKVALKKDRAIHEKLADPAHDAPFYNTRGMSKNAMREQVEDIQEFEDWFFEFRYHLPLKKYIT
ncbi:hypothetical protein KJ758_02595 [Patescibacteria group bacterium]|nr:hypothetical protein [Patescibacteria group bacterium]